MTACYRKRNKVFYVPLEKGILKHVSMQEALQKIKSSPVYPVLLVLVAFLYWINFDVNDIWTENESYYTEAVREMFESGNFIDIHYNYEPRFNKPPLTYWIIASSVALFGNNEFAARLPILILAFLTTILTYKTVRLLHGEETAVLAFAMQAVSIQFMAGKQYASPEIPLAFFFSLTMYWFIQGRITRNSLYTLLAGTALGLTILTKGYPYFIIIGGIIVLYLLIDTAVDRKKLIQELKSLHLPVTIPLALLIGGSWIAVMYFSHGDEFTAVLKKETIDRALTEKTNGLRDLLFYPEVILWSFFPYSLVFYASLGSTLLSGKRIRNVSFAFSWFFVMLVIFTMAKGKIPTYFIQAHPAMAIMASCYLVALSPEDKRKNIIVQWFLLIPALLAVAAGALMIPVFELPPLLYAIPLVALAVITLPYLLPAHHRHRRILIYLQPFSGTYAALLVMSLGVMPQLEQFRLYDKIGAAIKSTPSISTDLPIYLQDDRLHNLPYYAERRVIYKADPEEVQQLDGPVLALLRSRDITPENRKHVIWSGKVYRWISSESRLMIYIRNHLKAKNGDFSGYIDYSLLYRE
ncbi:MAG: glycosyltransferase family 39 protein [Chlorobiales bacterium]|nr:glycosyltransferase family 39 protein [Chlorobiales bacterium]